METSQNAQTVMMMAEAHLKSVQNAINDLEQQKEKINQEINRLNEYLKNGVDNLQKFSQTVFSDKVVDKDDKQTYYLGN